MPVCIQISHAGRKASSAAPWDGGMLIAPEDGGWQTVAPSALPHLPQEAAPTELSLADIAQIKADFVNTARRSHELGIEAVELHAAHGYLISQFLPPRSNQRTDRWGGSLENRAALLLRVVEGSRAAVGPAFPISVKLNSADFQKGGFAFEDSLRLVQWLQERCTSRVDSSQ